MSDATPLMLACANGKEDMAQILIDNGADLNSLDQDGWNAVNWAARWGQLECLRLLWSKGANMINEIGAKGFGQEKKWRLTPLH